MQSWFTIELNGKPWRLENVPMTVSLLDGLKARGEIDSLVAAEIDQGGVLVLMLDGDRERRPVFRAINCAAVPLVTMADKKIWTLAGLQEAFSDHPLWGIENHYPTVETHSVRRDNLLISLFEWCGLSAEQRKERPPAGCISRTADYAAVKSMIAEVRKVEGAAAKHLLEETVIECAEMQYVDGEKNRFYRPQTIVELFELIRQFPNAKVIAGAIAGTKGGDGEKRQGGMKAGNGDGKKQSPARVLLSAEGIGELRSTEDEGSHWEIGAAVPLAEITQVLSSEYPELEKILQAFETGAFRNRATLAGQLNTHLGRSDLGPVLLALDARVRLASEGGARDLTLDRFFGSQGGPVLRVNEIINSVNLPRNSPEMLRAKDCEVRLCDAYKVSARRTACPAMVTAAFALELNHEKKIGRAILAYGGLTSRPLLAVKTAAFLKGRVWNQETVMTVLKELDEEIAGLGKLEVRDGRRLWVTTLLQKFYHQHPGLEDVKPRRSGVIEKRLAAQHSAV